MRRIAKPNLVLAAMLSLAAPAAIAQNLLVNPDFDANIAGWTVVAGTDPTWLADVDHDECDGSGSLRVTSVADPEPLVGVLQCIDVAVPEGEQVTASARILQIEGNFALSLSFYMAAGCDGGFAGGDVDLGTVNPVAWTEYEVQLTAPAGVQSILFQMEGSVAENLSSSVFPSFDTTIDRAWVGFGQPLFWDDLGAASTCRWSGSVGVCDPGYAGATVIIQGEGTGVLPIAAHGVGWVSFVNGFPNHQIRAYNESDGVDLVMEIWYPDGAFAGCPPADYSHDDVGAGTGLSELHNTSTLAAPIPDGTVWIRVTNKTSTAGSFSVFDSD